jgi:hypothetical protein
VAVAVAGCEGCGGVTVELRERKKGGVGRVWVWVRVRVGDKTARE